VNDEMPAVEAYKDALIKGDDTIAGYLATDVIVETNFGRAEGAEQALALLREPRTSGLLAGGAEWSGPVPEGDTITVTAKLPPTTPFGGVEFVFLFADGKITRVEHRTLPAAALTPTELHLTEEIRNAIDGAFDNQTPVLIGYENERGEIHLSFRGTVQAYSGDQLALWARDPEGGLPRNIAARPRVTLFYHDPASRTTYSFYGRAQVSDDPSIYENSPARERQMDFRRRGVGIVVDLDKVEGRGPGGRLLMVRRELRYLGRGDAP
jgi:hypothetical protein